MSCSNLLLLLCLVLELWCVGISAVGCSRWHCFTTLAHSLFPAAVVGMINYFPASYNFSVNTCHVLSASGGCCHFITTGICIQRCECVEISAAMIWDLLCGPAFLPFCTIDDKHYKTMSRQNSIVVQL